MSWFGFGGDKKEPEPSASVNYDHNPYDSSHFNDSSAASSASSFNSGMSSGGGSSGRSLQEEIQAEAQKIEIQQMILQMTNMAFDKCIARPSSSLAGSERSCIEGSIGKYIDSKVFITQKLTGGQH